MNENHPAGALLFLRRLDDVDPVRVDDPDREHWKQYCLERGWAEYRPSAAGGVLFDVTASGRLALFLRDGEAKTEPQPEPEPTIWFHGGTSYSTDGRAQMCVTAEEDAILTAFLKCGHALQTERLEIEAGYKNVARVMKGLAEKFGPAVVMPGKSKRGYLARVRHAPK